MSEMDEIRAALAEVVAIQRTSAEQHQSEMAELRALTQSNARAIEALANQQNDDRDETVNVELDILDRIAERDERLDATLLEMGDAINRLTMAVIGLLQRSA